MSSCKNSLVVYCHYNKYVSNAYTFKERASDRIMCMNVIVLCASKSCAQSQNR